MPDEAGRRTGASSGWLVAFALLSVIGMAAGVAGVVVGGWTQVVAGVVLVLWIGTALALTESDLR
jgi:hypothetical protein